MNQDAKVVEAYSMDGHPLCRLDLKPETEKTLIDNFQKAQHDYEAEPENPDTIIWLGRRLGYLTRCKNAIDVFTKGLVLYPDNYKLLRHRGHRYVSIRKFDLALNDFTAATHLIQDVPDEIEPDGMPNASGTPTSTSHFNIWYHLGLTQYLMGHYAAALESYQSCLDFCQNDDATTALANWQYNTLLRLKRKDDALKVLAPITEHMTIIDDPGYHHLLLHYKGMRNEKETLNLDSDGNPESITIAYGIANRAHCSGDKEKAVRILQHILKSSFWPAFGYIAAEVDLLRLEK